MYDINKRIGIENMTVSELIGFLSELPQDAVISTCGDSMTFIHVERDGSVVTIDNEDLDDLYIDDEETTPDEFFTSGFKTVYRKIEKPRYTKNDVKNMSSSDAVKIILDIAKGKAMATRRAIDYLDHLIGTNPDKYHQIERFFNKLEFIDGAYKYFKGTVTYITDFGGHEIRNGRWITVSEDLYKLLESIMKGVKQ